MTISRQDLSKRIKARGIELGFSAVGISRAEPLSDEARRLERWLNAGMHGEMKYMEDHFEKRVNPKALMPEAKSVVSVLANYFPSQRAISAGGKISIYAQGTDYHRVVKSKLQALFDFICELVGSVNGRAFVDSAPTMDKALAQRSGLGWIGKHTNLISRPLGSFFFIGNLLLDCELAYDAPHVANYCGSCTACIDLCPTQAITLDHQVDARKCISYLTIELKRDFTDEEKSMLGEWLFGCDVCQDVCPWNRFSKPTTIAEFAPKPDAQRITESDILEMTKSSFKRVFGETPVFRTGLRRMKRNAEAVRENLARRAD
ncbi:MAG: tRNA epoxyqueuosine(34) reductase QueG [Chloroherpetonaceae bacterium]|nr:tRNA epoxyqueuosine(34) reductase QueG [Chloroherpetonaceae bacterium]MDW8437225.1 tRNA epoxyqueuosine(34) reductase QueG [Chloroherpetonaceae bacterium]